jgi:hypothetical protein
MGYMMGFMAAALENRIQTDVLAEAVRFELTEELPLRGFSRPVP